MNETEHDAGSPEEKKPDAEPGSPTEASGAAGDTETSLFLLWPDLRSDRPTTSQERP